MQVRPRDSASESKVDCSESRTVRNVAVEAQAVKIEAHPCLVEKTVLSPTVAVQGHAVADNQLAAWLSAVLKFRHFERMKPLN